MYKQILFLLLGLVEKLTTEKLRVYLLDTYFIRERESIDHTACTISIEIRA